MIKEKQTIRLLEHHIIYLGLMKYKCIIFDCDGVLVDSEEISFKVLQDMILELGYPQLSNQLKDSYAGMAFQEILQEISTSIQAPLPRDFTKTFRIRSYEKFKTDIQEIRGIRALLESLEIPICVASSGPQEKIRLNLKTTDLIDYFSDHIFSAYDIKKWKPAPDIFLYAAKKMGFHSSECAVVEDSFAGIQAGIAGGFDVYAYCHPRKVEAFTKAGAVCFHDMKDLINLWA